MLVVLLRFYLFLDSVILAHINDTPVYKGPFVFLAMVSPYVEQTLKLHTWSPFNSMQSNFIEYVRSM